MTGHRQIKINLTAEDAAVEVSEEYIGELPPARKALPGLISKIYLSETEKGHPIFKVLLTCTEKPYTGYTAWDNVTLTPEAAFKWKPLIKALGVSVEDLATGVKTDPNDMSEAGERVVSIGKLNLAGEDSGVPVLFGVKYRIYEGTQQTDVIAIRPRGFSFTNGED